jgi:hypothetical protein
LIRKKRAVGKKEEAYQANEECPNFPQKECDRVKKSAEKMREEVAAPGISGSHTGKQT